MRTSRCVSRRKREDCCVKKVERIRMFTTTRTESRTARFFFLPALTNQSVCQLVQELAFDLLKNNIN